MQKTNQSSGQARIRRIRREYRKKLVTGCLISLVIGLIIGFVLGVALFGMKKNPDTVSTPVQNSIITAVPTSPATEEPVIESTTPEPVESAEANPETASTVSTENVISSIDFITTPTSSTDEAESTSVPVVIESVTAEPTAELPIVAISTPETVITAEPTVLQTSVPTEEPTEVPTAEPTVEPTEEPTPAVTPEPTPEPVSQPIIVAYGESVKIPSQILSSGNARRQISDEPYEDLEFTVRVKEYKSRSYYENTYGTLYDLKGGTAAVEFEITLNDYFGSTKIVPQNCLLFTLRGNDDSITTQGYQLIDKEIAGSTGIVITSNTPTTVYKRYAYDELMGEMTYMVVNAYIDGREITYWFDLVAPVPDPTPTVYVEPTAVPKVDITLEIGDVGTQVEQLQKELINRGFLEGTADGQYGSKTAEAVRKAQIYYNLDPTGKATPRFLKKFYNMED